MSLEDNKPKEKDNSLDAFFFHFLLFTVIILFPMLLTFLTWRFWGGN